MRWRCLKARAAGGGVIGRLVGQHPDGGPVTVRDGRYGAYVNWGKVNATIPKGTAPDSITLAHALELIAEREGRPAAQPRKGGESAGQDKAAKRRGASETVAAKKPAAPRTPASSKPPAKNAAASQQRRVRPSRGPPSSGMSAATEKPLHPDRWHTASMLLPSGSRTKAP